MTTTLELTVGDRRNPQSITIEVRILGERSAYGRTDVLVEPVKGSGQAWVSADRVKVRGK